MAQFDPPAPPPPSEEPRQVVRIQIVTCGRCGWPNSCPVQDGMRCLRFYCHWCEQMAMAIVDPTIRGMVIF